MAAQYAPWCIENSDATPANCYKDPSEVCENDLITQEPVEPPVIRVRTGKKLNCYNVAEYYKWISEQGTDPTTRYMLTNEELRVLSHMFEQERKQQPPLPELTRDRIVDGVAGRLLARDAEAARALAEDEDQMPEGPPRLQRDLRRYDDDDDSDVDEIEVERTMAELEQQMIENRRTEAAVARAHRNIEAEEPSGVLQFDDED